MMVIIIHATLSAPVDSVLVWPMDAKLDLFWSVKY